MKTPSNFIKLSSLNKSEIYSHEETMGAYSWQGYIDNISKSDIKHLESGKPLMLVINDEYIEILKLAK